MDGARFARSWLSDDADADSRFQICQRKFGHLRNGLFWESLALGVRVLIERRADFFPVVNPVFFGAVGTLAPLVLRTQGEFVSALDTHLVYGLHIELLGTPDWRHFGWLQGDGFRLVEPA